MSSCLAISGSSLSQPPHGADVGLGVPRFPGLPGGQIGLRDSLSLLAGGTELLIDGSTLLLDEIRWTRLVRHVSRPILTTSLVSTTSGGLNPECQGR